MASGTVKWFNEKKGFGFIVPSGGGEDIFLHRSNIQTESRSVAEGQKVQYETAPGKKGLQAVDVRAE